MKELFDTVDKEWRSPIAEEILENWGYDEGSVYVVRASANFVFVCKKHGKHYFLRFNRADERDVDAIEAEIQLLLYLNNKSLKVAQPVVSRNNRYIEVVETAIGTYYAVVFEALDGDQFEIDELSDDQFMEWGKALGKLHGEMKKITLPISRRSHQDHLETVRRQLPKEEVEIQKELQSISKWIDRLPRTDENYGLIHYDFELDNLCWHHSQFSALDFDDSAYYWYLADIAYALRDLFEEKVDLNCPSFLRFVDGYKQETAIDEALLEQLPMFLRLHELVTFTKLLRTVDIPKSTEYPKWLQELREKLINKLDDYRKSL